MNWQNLKMKEIKYYCFSSRLDFDCLPFSRQIEEIACLFFYYDITKFEIEDIKEFYQRIQIPSPRADGIRKPSPSQIRKALERLKNLQHVSKDTYVILYANTEIYEEEIKSGYEKNKII